MPDEHMRVATPSARAASVQVPEGMGRRVRIGSPAGADVRAGRVFGAARARADRAHAEVFETGDRSNTARSGPAGSSRSTETSSSSTSRTVG